MGANYFTREGYILSGWNTEPDGSGTHIGLGSRVLFNEGLTLYAEWIEATEESFFEFANGTILSYSGNEDTVAVPETIGGETVKAIASGAFHDLSVRSLLFPPSLETVEDGAFTDCMIETLTLFDRVRTISDTSFSGCTILSLRINAARLPVYSGSYYDTFSDKYDYLLSLSGQRKLVLFSGSSGRYGYRRSPAR